MRGGDEPPAVVISGSANALSAARALAGRGVEVHAIGHRASPVRWSRRIATFADAGLDGGASGRTLDWLESHRSGGVLVPCSDDALELVLDNWERLGDWGFVLPEMDPALARVLLDKERTYDLARRIGVRSPRTIVPDPTVDAAAALGTLGSPCAVKPRRSDAAGAMVGKGIVVRTPEELDRALALVQRATGSGMVTEIVPGRDDRLASYWAYVDAGGRTLLEMTKRKLRQHPVGFGTGCNAVTGWDPEVAEIGRRFARGAGLVGFAATEFKRRDDTGELVLIESNYRLVDANEQGRAAGLDVAWIAYQRALGRPVDVQPPARDGVYFWHPVRDFRSCRALGRAGGGSLTSWALGVTRTFRTPYFSASDPRPSLMVATAGLRHALARGAARMAGVLRPPA
jgi:predicted ATP-grasp superfamily ATP-dependent carboligase